MPDARKFLVNGHVQGVGFRPFVFREAIKHNLTGWVRNSPRGVEILAAGPHAALDLFEQTLLHHAPFPARVTSVQAEDVVAPDHGDFRILASDLGGEIRTALLPDLAICPECLRDISDPANRRYRYPFTNCTACGPRYSIMLGLPYDRERTTMAGFPLCPECRAEFENPADRRFHAQPNACPRCGPQLALWDSAGRAIAHADDALTRSARLLREGQIVAVKGLGGFHLMADAASDQAVRLLRARKHRDEKPFAVMVPDLLHVRRLAVVTSPEIEVLLSAAAPIVLLAKRTPPVGAPLSRLVAPGQSTLGLFLPYTPLHRLLLDEVGFPLVATSGNLGDEPICIDEHEARERLAGIADFFLVHNRPIAHPVEDSVVRVALGRPLVLRAGRGLAPMSITIPEAAPALGVGAHMKATVALGGGGRLIIGPHIGDLTSPDSHAAHRRSVTMLEGMLGSHPDVVACDVHPDYASTRYAGERSAQPLRVQHHHAHILAVMAEHELRGPVLGVAWDGTGYGPDGTIWGGEFLRVDETGFVRVGRLRAFPLPGGDAAAREPRRSALGVLHGIKWPNPIDLSFTPAEHAVLVQAMEKKINTVFTYSAGRLFDAVAALVGLCLRSSFEGQAAMQLQAEAERIAHDESDYGVWPVKKTVAGQPITVIDWAAVIEGILTDRMIGTPVPVIAARFHQSMVNSIVAMALGFPDLPVVLAGGCFQNVWLLERTVRRLREMGFQVYWPRRLPPNDGAIAAGQVLAAAFAERR